MAWQPPSAGELRDRVRFERRGPKQNVGGVVRQDWETLIPGRRVRLLPVRGGEQTQADRAAGVSLWELVVRSCSVTREVTTDDRAVDTRDPTRTWNIRFAENMQGDGGAWILMQIEAGVADG